VSLFVDSCRHLMNHLTNLLGTPWGQKVKVLLPPRVQERIEQEQVWFLQEEV
jgi:hypothetical protein